jgi:hypothetical protein
MTNWAVKKALAADTKTWVIVVLVILLFLGGGIAGTMLVLRKRRYGKLVHEKNLLEEEKLANKAKEELAANDEQLAKARADSVKLGAKEKRVNEEIEALETKHGKVKLALDDVTSWDDLRIE